MGEHTGQESLGDIPDDARKNMKGKEPADEKSIGEDMDEAQQAAMRPTGSGGSAPPPQNR